MVDAILYVWAAWIAGCCLMYIAGALFSKPQHPQFNGFSVFIPAEWVLILEKDELRMVIMHEHGHRAHLHTWRNLFRLFFFIPMTATRRIRQELQADDYVTDPLALASALRKMSDDAFDLLRATRLEAKAGVVPNERDARLSTQGS